MAITVKCGACGNTAQAPDSAAGAKGKCRACGAVVEIPKLGSQVSASRQAGSSPQKMCVACGVDVAGKKRTKDPKGNYYCQPCWDAKVREGRAVPVGAAAGAGAGAAPGASAGSGGATDEAVDFPCAVCGVLGGPDDVYDDNGRYVCKTCWDAEDAGAGGGPTARPDPVWAPDQSAAHPPLPPLPPVPGAAAPAAPVAPVAADDLLFCEGCGGSFTINNLTTTPDGAVLCKDCVAGVKKPPARAGTVFAPPPPGFVPKPAKEKWKGPSTGSIFAGSGGLLVVLLIVGKIALRGCVSYERAQRRERYNNNNVPAQVEEDSETAEE